MNQHPAGLSPISRLSAALAIFAALSSPLAHAADKKGPPPARPAAEYPANDAHSDDHVTIAIDPCEAQKDCSFFRLPYVAHSMMPVRIIITNDSDSTLSLDDVRMQFISADNDKLPAANLDDINRRMFTFRESTPTTIPGIPIPIHHPPALDKKVIQDDQDFGFQTTTVKAHSTIAGYLFYDLKQFDQTDTDPLKGAQIYIKMIRTADSKKELFSFTIPFNKWIAAQSKPDSTQSKSASAQSTKP
jgi:hypothetical protein